MRIIRGRARFVAPHAVEVNGERITGDRVLIATGVSPRVPPIPGLAEAGYLTNESLFELEELPESLIVLGGRYVALECAQAYARFGSTVTILQRSDRILPTESADLTDALTGYLREDGIEVVAGVVTTAVRREHGRIVVETNVNGAKRLFRSSHILVATGRLPNTSGMGLDDFGIKLDKDGSLAVDDTLRSTALPQRSRQSNNALTLDTASGNTLAAASRASTAARRSLSSSAQPASPLTPSHHAASIDSAVDSTRSNNARTAFRGTVSWPRASTARAM